MGESGKIHLKTDAEIAVMREAGRIARRALMAGAAAVRVGATTLDVDRAVHQEILRSGATPSFLGYHPDFSKSAFRHASCVSLNNEVVHGVPSAGRTISDGDLVKVDVGACYQGWHGDTAMTVAAGELAQNARSLMGATEEALAEAIKAVRVGADLMDVAKAVEGVARSWGFRVVRGLCGHGVGRELHERPAVMNEVVKNMPACPIVPGLVIAIEPMLSARGATARTMEDGWTVVTVDRSWSAHFEHTVAVMEDGCEILTRDEE